MNKRGGGEKKKPAVFSTSSVGRSLCDIVRPFWIPMETKKKKINMFARNAFINAL